MRENGEMLYVDYNKCDSTYFVWFNIIDYSTSLVKIQTCHMLFIQISFGTLLYSILILGLEKEFRFQVMPTKQVSRLY